MKKLSKILASYFFGNLTIRLNRIQSEFFWALRIGIIPVFVIIFALIGSFSLQEAYADTFLVNSSNDDSDTDGCDSTHCSLREAILDANSNPGLDSINFLGPGPFNILPDSPLPSITSPVVIDGGGWQVVINGQNAGPLADGLTLFPGGSTVRGLVINNFDGNGISLAGSNNVIEGNKIGTDATGTIAMGNGFYASQPTLALHGIQVSGSSNTIGGTTAAARNIISGNFGAGVAVFDFSNNVVQGNYIGTDITGTLDVGNFFGVSIVDAPNTLVGGTADGAGNIISGNDGLGIQIFTTMASASVSSSSPKTIDIDTIETGKRFTSATENDQYYIEPHFSPTTQNLPTSKPFPPETEIDYAKSSENTVTASFINDGNKIEGNYIGTDVSGTLDLGNTFGGIQISDVPDNTIGGSFAARNIISGNDASGISIFDLGAEGNVIQSNFIGTDVTGTAALGNNNNGIQIQRSQNNTIGGNLPGLGNVVSANGGQGILIGDPSVDDSSGNVVQRNIIGADITGFVDLGNGGSGIAIQNGPDNQIGGTSEEERNYISGNGVDGVTIVSPGSTRVMVQGNYIGTDLTGAAGLGNSESGVRILDARNNTIGGTSSGAGNLISGNLDSGITIIDSESSLPSLFTFNNTVQGNFIGTDFIGTSAIGNTEHGVLIVSSPLNKIGGDEAGARNIISGNLQNGILLAGNLGPNAFNNTIAGNRIGTKETGFADLGNGFAGIHIENVPNNIIGGTTAQARNLISGNDQNGIVINGMFATGNKIEGNYIGTDVTGTSGIGNSLQGVFIGAPSNVVGGNTAGTRNIISSNQQGGIFISGNVAQENNVTANYIGTDVTGTVDLGNALNGIEIFNAVNATVGGFTAAERNIISGNNRNGVVISGIEAKNNTISGNFIGSDVSGMVDLGNSENGVQIIGASSNQIGQNMSLTQGSCTGGCNLIFGNDLNGVEVLDNTAVGNSIRFNSIFDNTMLGIDLGGDGVTPNDNSKNPANVDADVGPNKLINFPSGVSANKTAGGQTAVSGILKTETSEMPVIDIYYNQNHDPSKFGEGQHYWGTVNMTSIGPNGTFNFVVPGAVPFNFVSAVAVGKDGSTSEFSFVCGDPDGDGNTDSDGDGLCDDWEISGIDFDGDNTADLDLPGLGAKWNHKDIFVEVDHWDMHKPLPVDFENVTLAFSKANVANPDGMTGINIHIEHATGDTMPHMDPTTGNMNQLTMWAGFDTLKKNFFGTAAQRADASGNAIDAKKLAYRYAIMVHEYVGSGGSSGLAEGIPGDDFIVSLGGWGMRGGHAGGNQHQIEGTFMHELGHTLGLRHGGIEHDNCKPNYLSIMNYMFQFNYVINSRPLDYSRSALNTLRENALLSEPAGIIASTPPNLKTFYANATHLHAATAGFQVDWNTDGDTMDVGVTQNINNMTSQGCDGFGQVLEGANDWQNIHYNFRNSVETFADGAHMPMAFETTEIKLDDLYDFVDRATFPVKQIDNTAPELVCPSPIFVMSSTDVPVTDPQIQAFLSSVIATDNLDPSPIVTNDAPANFPVGQETIVIFTASDDQTNSSQCTSSVSVGNDMDGDGVIDPDDNCPGIPNSGQEDIDDDNMGDACDSINEINTSKTITTNHSLVGDLIVQDGAILTVPNGLSITIQNPNNLHVQAGGRLSLESGGSLSVG